MAGARSSVVAWVALSAACGSVGARQSTSPQSDDGGADAGGAEGGACGAPQSGSVSCGGVCMPESVDACGAQCAKCGRPAPSHGDADCLDGRCTLTCNGAYAPCGASACCGVALDGDAVAIVAAGSFSCGITSNATAWCWGDGSYGALGNGALQGQTATPQKVVNLGDVAAIALGDRHACALTKSGAVACWGDDAQGQLGDASRNPEPAPVTPQGLSSGVAAIAAGSQHTCVVTKSGGAKCWGDDTYGQLGDGQKSTQGSLTPVDVSGLTSGVAAIAAGAAHTCAMTTGGGVKCWGSGGSGQLGGASESTSPVDVSLPSTAKAIAAGGSHTCVLASDGHVLCWGLSDANQLGIGRVPPHASAVSVPRVANVVAIAAGGDETCALDAGGAVTCWGVDPVGDTGKAFGGPAVVPSLGSGIAAIGVVSGHACAVTAGGAPKCWGTNDAGQLGDGTTIDSWVPVDVRGM